MALHHVGSLVRGTLSYRPSGYKHILVAIDKFTKWIKVRPVVKVTSEEAAKFIGDITHCFGVPNRIITNLGRAFTGSAFWDFGHENTIDVYYSSVAHPRCNNQVECANSMVLQALKDRIYDDASNYATRWLAELPHVIWGLRTQVSSATGFLPFFLVYRSEAILPTDIAFEAPCIQFCEEGEAEQTRRVDLDSLEEQRLAAVMRDKPIMTNNFNDTMTATLRKLPSMLATSSSGASRRPMACTSSLPLGKDPSSSLKLSAYPLIASNGVTDKECQTLGTWSTNDDSIRGIVFKFQLCISFPCTFSD
jgi:hypothetical protein